MTSTTEIKYKKEGNGTQTIVFVHGWGGSSESFSRVQSLLSEDFTTISIDLPGFGQSSMPEPNWGVEEYADALIQFLVRQKVEKCIYVGHSFGGALGVYLAANFPENITKLILIAPAFRRDLKTFNFNKWQSLVIHPFKKVPLMRSIFYKLFFPESDILKFPKLESNFKKIVTQDLTYLLPKINQATLILWGTADKETPIENADILNKGIKNSQLKVFKNAAHGLQLKYPNEVYLAIKEFLTK